MKAYFDRHEVDKKGQGWSQGEDGFPSAGRVAWALWGGNPGRSWANSLVEQMNAGGERAAAYPEDDDETLKSYEDTDMTERDMALTNAYRDIGTKMGEWTEEDCYYLDEKTGKIMCRSTKDESEGAKSAMSAMDNLNAAPREGEQREAAVVEEPATTEPPAPPAPTQKQRDDAEAIAAIAALDAVVLETHLHDSSATT
jgi:hypothetical protein